MSQSINDQIDTTQAFKYHWLIWKYYGLQPPSRNSKWYKPYFAYALILNLSILWFPASLIINLFLSQNLAELCENLYNTTKVMVLNIKFFNMIAVKHKLLQAKSILETLDASAKRLKERQILKDGLASADRIFKLFLRLTFCGVITSHMIVYLSSERTLMYPAWYPWDWKASKINFFCAHSYQAYGVTLQAIQNLVNETYPLAFLIILSSHIKALSLRIKDLNSGGTKSEEMVYQDLTDCIKDHITVHKLFLNIQETISITCLVQFAACGLIQCTIAAYALYVGSDPSKLANLFLYFMVVTAEIFVLCYYGDLYCQANDHLTESIYASNWVDQNQKYKKTFLFLLQRSQITSTLMAGHLIPVRMPTFVRIVKTAYSVFTILNKSK